MLLRRFLPLAAIAFAAAAPACSSRNDTVNVMVETDAGTPDVVDAPVFIGPGNLALTWTVNGMPAATGCAMAGAANVEIQLSFGGSMRVPCTDGMFSQMNVLAGQYSIGTNLLRADGTSIYQYHVETTINSNKTTNATVDFSPPGTLRVNWTLNGMPASSQCAMTNGYGVQVEVHTQRNMGIACSAGRASWANVQAGHYTAHAVLFGMDSHSIDTQDAEGDVPSGGVGQITVDFTAPPRMQ